MIKKSLTVLIHSWKIYLEQGRFRSWSITLGRCTRAFLKKWTTFLLLKWSMQISILLLLWLGLCFKTWRSSKHSAPSLTLDQQQLQVWKAKANSSCRTIRCTKLLSITNRHWQSSCRVSIPRLILWMINQLLLMSFRRI